MSEIETKLNEAVRKEYGLQAAKYQLTRNDKVTILDTHVKAGNHEIDIVAQDALGCIIFCNVRIVDNFKTKKEHVIPQEDFEKVAIDYLRYGDFGSVPVRYDEINLVAYSDFKYIIRHDKNTYYYDD